jgi:virginiamycin B lyase
MSTDGVTTEYTVPTAASVPQGIAAGPDGALWFTERFANKVGRITTTGVITEYAVSSGKWCRRVNDRVSLDATR